MWFTKFELTMKKVSLLLIFIYISCIPSPIISYKGERNEDDKYHGKGIITFINGEKWEGEFKDGRPYNGQGTYTFLNGDKWEGEWKKGYIKGQGAFTSRDGRKYVGELKNGLRNGQGILTLPDSSKYEGEFKNDKRNGKGVLFKVNGETQSGTWVNDILKLDFHERKDEIQPTTNVSLQRNDDILLPPSPDNPTFIAVVDFRGNNVTEGDCRALTDRLRIELYNTKHYKVIERAMMDDILEEQKFQKSGCVSDECIVEIGKMIGVEQIVGDSISQVGNIFSV